MKNILKTVGALIIVIGLLGSSAALQAFAAVHTLQFVETPAVALYASQSGTAITMVITPVPKDLAGNTLTMSSFGSSPTVTVDPGILGAEEIESFTSLTNNGNNTVTLGGITRALQSVYPYSGPGTGITHGAGAVVVFSNNPQLYNRLAAWENDGSITGVYSFVTQPVYNTSQVFSNPLALIDKAYADALSITGAPTSTFNGMGVVWLATNAQISAGTASSTTGAPLVIPAKAASSTYNGATAFQGEIPALRSTKDIDPNFIATSTGNNYNWGGLHTFNATTTMATTTAASSTITTANIATLNVTNFNGQVTNYQDFLANGTWTKPAAASTSDIVIVQAWGGGGGGGSGANTTSGGAGGGGGACTMTQFRMSDLSATESITIGAGGGGTGGAVGTVGGNTTFGSHFTTYGGGGGGGASQAGGGGGGGGSFSVGSVGLTEAGSGAAGGAGGGPAGGAGGTTSGTVGSDGNFGGGGGGGHANAGTAGNGGTAYYGGAGGGAGTTGGTGADGGKSYCGGGGGGGGSTANGVGGTSVMGGAGGAGGATGVTGTVPGGGGGGSRNNVAGATGGAGEVRVWIIK